MDFNKTDVYIETLMREFPDKVNWDAISKNDNVSVNFIEKYFDKLNIAYILQNSNIFPEHIEKWFSEDEIKKFYCSICHNPNLTNVFVRKYYIDRIYQDDNVDFYKFVKYSNAEFVSNYAGIINYMFFMKYKYIDLFDTCFKYQHWMQKFEKKNFWRTIGMNPNITPSFIEKYADKINWRQIRWNPSITKEFIDKYYLNFNWHSFLFESNIPYEYCAQYLHMIGQFNYSYINDLPLDIFEKNIGVNCWFHSNVDANFVENHITHVNWIFLSQNPSLSMDLIRKYGFMLNWKFIWANSFNTAPPIYFQIIDNVKTIYKISILSINDYKLIELIDSKTQHKMLYKTYASMATLNYLIDNQDCAIIDKTSNGIKIDLDDDIIYAFKIEYDH